MKTTIKRIGFASLFIVSALFLGGYYPDMQIRASNSASVDAFGRWRTSTPITLFDAQNEYTAGELWWNHDNINGADTNFYFNGQPVVDLIGVATAGTRSIRQTKEYFRYQSGNSLLIVVTLNPHVGKQGMRKLWGYGDSLNGIFFQLQGDTLGVVKRSNATGSIIDSVVIQANWNSDKGDGTGASGYNIRTYRSNVFWIDIAWLGVHRVRMGTITEAGEYVVLHQWLNANANVGVYMRNANLPVRYELRHWSGSAVADTLTTICATVKSEAGDNNLAGINQSVTRGVAGVTKTTAFTPYMSIRLDTATFMGILNRVAVRDISLGLSCATSVLQWQLVYDATLTGATWRAMPTYTGVSGGGRVSGVQYDTSATAYTGGIVVASGYVASGGVGATAVSGAVASSVLSKLPLHNGIKGNVGVPLVLVVRGITASPTAVHGFMSWKEIY